jgi:hypothetical protein
MFSVYVAPVTLFQLNVGLVLTPVCPFVGEVNTAAV